MHGRPRKTATATTTIESSLKSSKIRSLQSQFLHNHHNNIYTKEALEINEKLILVNPDFLTAWNYRKLAFQHNIDQKNDLEHVKSIIDEELRLVESALRKNCKTYGAWYHRKWVVSKGYTSTERELGLLQEFQLQDTRNFHAWNYRRFIAGLKNIPDEQELKFATDMIENNLDSHITWVAIGIREIILLGIIVGTMTQDTSNYSAWHYRSVLLTQLMAKKVEGYFPKENMLKNEYEYVHHAILPDPDDQSGWFYHLWLLDQTVKVDMPTLVSSSPPHGSDVNQSIFPVVLYFSEPVEGISSHTVTVQTTENDIFKNIIWTPLSTNNYKCGQAWMTHLRIPHEQFNSFKAVQVKISSEHSQGITSLSGVSCNRPWSFTFMVSVCFDLKPVEEQIIERISLTDENFCAIDTNSNSTALIKSYFESSNDFEESISSQWKSALIASEIDHFREALKWAQGKIVKLTLARLLMTFDAVKSSGSPKLANVEEVLQLYMELMKLDPPHNQYYKDEYSLVLLKQVTSSKESLLKYCWQYKESTPSIVTDCLCLRLNNLSLSRIGFFERLLWVQSLDLSYNQLHSIEGLEALQLLSCLNLSHNKLSSFMALDPLRFLKSSLKVLDISYNEIGAHTVDTKGYLCSSPMSHTLDYDTKFEEFANGDAKSVNFWDAYSIFGGLNLMQLDIVGNVGVDKRFVQFLVKLMHGLKWFDGEELN